jgi:outer membrane protein assembly factor BamB
VFPPASSSVLAIGIILLSPAVAQDWTQWRGPNRDGAIKIVEPKAWPEKLSTKWKITIGDGYASPLFAAGRIFEFARQGDDEVAMAIDPENGKIVWQQRYPAPFKPVDAAAKHGKGPKSTPLFYNGHLITFGISGALSSFDATTGKLDWQKQYSKDFKATWPMFGTSMSPAASDGVVVGLVGTNDDGAVVAYEAKSGEQKWIWKGDGPAYASPVIMQIDGVKQVITMTQKYAVGLSLGAGELLWRIDFPGRSGMNIPTPLPFGQRVILAGDPGTMLMQITKGAGSWTAEKTWTIPELTMRFSSPVQKGNLIFGFTNRNTGMFFCADAEAGKTLWTSEPRQGDNASILLAGDLLLLLKDNAEFIVARASPTAFEPLHRYEVATSSTYATPLVIPNGLVVKDNTSLSFLSWE